MSQRCIISSSGGGDIVNGCQEGPLSIGTSNTTSISLATDGCVERLTVAAAGNVTILAPDSGIGLTVNEGIDVVSGDVTVDTGNIVLPEATASTQGSVIFGGSNTAVNVNMYNSGDRSIFIGNGSVNTAAVGEDNISIGTEAGASLTTQISTISIGAKSFATGDFALAIGSNDAATTNNGANAGAASTIAIGSAGDTLGGAGASATATNAIAIGSARTSLHGAEASGVSGIAIGGADSAIYGGASASGNRSIAIGSNATASNTQAIAIGSSTGQVTGAGAVASGSNSIAIGGGLTNAAPGPRATGTSAISIGVNSQSSALNTFAIGVSSLANQNHAMAFGSGVQSTAQFATSIGYNSQATAASALAVGSGNASASAAIASGAGSVALGGADGAVNGAAASGARSVAIGNGAATSQADAILLGNASVTAVKVGIGIAAPTSKLHVVGVDGTPVVTFNQVNTAIGNAPVWLNPATSAGAGTPIHYDGSNRLFGFTSSARYKENIRPMGDYSKGLYELKPTLYDARDGSGKDISGFIAEDVAETRKELVIYNREGQPENVAYNSIIAMLVNEVQQLRKEINELKGIV